MAECDMKRSEYRRAYSETDMDGMRDMVARYRVIGPVFKYAFSLVTPSHQLLEVLSAAATHNANIPDDVWRQRDERDVDVEAERECLIAARPLCGTDAISLAVVDQQLRELDRVIRNQWRRNEEDVQELDSRDFSSWLIGRSKVDAARDVAPGGQQHLERVNIYGASSFDDPWVR